MKTSNKLLLIAFALILAGIVVTIAKVKQYVVQNTEYSGNGPIELSGEVIQKDYTISDFKKLKVEGAVSLTLAKGENNSLKIKADSAIFKRIEVIDENNVLTIRLTNTNGKKVKAIAELISANMNIEKFVVNAGSRVTSEDTVATNEMNIDVNAGGKLTLNVNANEINCDANAGGFSELKGKAAKLSAEANAGGHIHAKDLMVTNAKVRTNAGGQIYVYVNGELDAKCNAGGVVKYYGNPDIKNIDINAGGRISRAD